MRSRRPFRVCFTGVAEQDLQGIIRHLAGENPDAALEVLDQLEARTASLRSMPERGRVVPELAAVGLLLYRELIEAPWRIIYRSSGPDVYTLAVLDGRRNVEDILLERVTR